MTVNPMNVATMLRGSGPHIAQRWALEADGTRYEAIVVYDYEQGDFDYALVCLNMGGGAEYQTLVGHEHYQRWTVHGGGTWYVLRQGNGPLAESYIAEKFRLEPDDARNVTTLLSAALAREAVDR